MPVQNRDIFMEKTGDPLFFASSVYGKSNLLAALLLHKLSDTSLRVRLISIALAKISSRSPERDPPCIK